MESGKEKMEEGVQTCLQWKEKRGGNKNRVREGREFKTLGFRDWGEREREKEREMWVEGLWEENIENWREKTGESSVENEQVWKYIEVAN